MIYWTLGYLAIGMAIAFVMRRRADIFGSPGWGDVLLIVTTWPIGLVVAVNMWADSVERRAKR